MGSSVGSLLTTSEQKSIRWKGVEGTSEEAKADLKWREEVGNVFFILHLRIVGLLLLFGKSRWESGLLVENDWLIVFVGCQVLIVNFLIYPLKVDVFINRR